jgi:hypothetical protein
MSASGCVSKWSADSYRFVESNRRASAMRPQQLRLRSELANAANLLTC